MAATSETATAGTMVFGDFMAAPLLPARGTVGGAMASFNVEGAACSADPVDHRIKHSRPN